MHKMDMLKLNKDFKGFTRILYLSIDRVVDLMKHIKPRIISIGIIVFTIIFFYGRFVPAFDQEFVFPVETKIPEDNKFDRGKIYIVKEGDFDKFFEGAWWFRFINKNNLEVMRETKGKYKKTYSTKGRGAKVKTWFKDSENLTADNIEFAIVYARIVENDSAIINVLDNAATKIKEGKSDVRFMLEKEGTTLKLISQAEYEEDLQEKAKKNEDKLQKIDERLSQLVSSLEGVKGIGEMQKKKTRPFSWLSLSDISKPLYLLYIVLLISAFFIFMFQRNRKQLKNIKSGTLDAYHQQEGLQGFILEILTKNFQVKNKDELETIFKKYKENVIKKFKQMMSYLEYNPKKFIKIGSIKAHSKTNPEIQEIRSLVNLIKDIRLFPPQYNSREMGYTNERYGTDRINEIDEKLSGLQSRYKPQDQVIYSINSIKKDLNLIRVFIEKAKDFRKIEKALDKKTDDGYKDNKGPSELPQDILDELRKKLDSEYSGEEIIVNFNVENRTLPPETPPGTSKPAMEIYQEAPKDAREYDGELELNKQSEIIEKPYQPGIGHEEKSEVSEIQVEPTEGPASDSEYMVEPKPDVDTPLAILQNTYNSITRYIRKNYNRSPKLSPPLNLMKEKFIALKNKIQYQPNGNYWDPLKDFINCSFCIAIHEEGLVSIYCEGDFLKTFNLEINIGDKNLGDQAVHMNLYKVQETDAPLNPYIKNTAKANIELYRQNNLSFERNAIVKFVLPTLKHKVLGKTQGMKVITYGMISNSLSE